MMLQFPWNAESRKLHRVYQNVTPTSPGMLFNELSIHIARWRHLSFLICLRAAVGACDSGPQHDSRLFPPWRFEALGTRTVRFSN
jgi:hypothetical protein